MGNVRLYGATSGYTELAPPAVAPDGVLSLPSGTGTIAKTTDQGLVHINTTTFSAVSSVSIDDVFTSDYDNYRIIINSLSTNGAQALLMRLRLAGTDNTTANHYYMSAGHDSGNSGSSFGAGNQTRWQLTFMDTNVASITAIDFPKPWVSERKFVVCTSTGMNSNNTQYATRVTGLAQNGASSGDGFTTFVSSGTITGTIRVYGYKNGA